MQGDEIVFEGQASLGVLPQSYSARTWLSWVGPDSNLDTSRYIRSVRIPVLILVHEKDRVRGWNELYHSSAAASPKAELKLYTVSTRGDPHYFEGFEGQVVQDTIDWLSALQLVPVTQTTQQQVPTTTQRIEQEPETKKEPSTESEAETRTQTEVGSMLTETIQQQPLRETETRQSTESVPSLGYFPILGVIASVAVVIGILIKRIRKRIR